MNESTAIRAALDVRSRASSARVIRASARSLLERGLLGRSRSRSRGARDAIYDLEAAADRSITRMETDDERNLTRGQHERLDADCEFDPGVFFSVFSRTVHVQ